MIYLLAKPTIKAVRQIIATETQADRRTTKFCLAIAVENYNGLTMCMSQTTDDLQRYVLAPNGTRAKTLGSNGELNEAHLK